MADLEQRIINTQLNGKIEVVDAKFNQFMEEMREQNRMRAEEIKELRADMKEINKATDAKISEIRQSIDSMGKHVRNLAITAMIGIGAMALTVIYSAFK